MSIAKALLNKSDELYDEALNEEGWRLTVKAGLSGIIEGLIDGAIVMYPILVGGCYYWRKKATKK